jgi:uncharacterized protein GlcG (DUF336 family)
MKIASEQNVVHWEAAATAVAAAVRHAEKLKIKVNVAVVDAGGNLAAVPNRQKFRLLTSTSCGKSNCASSPK